MTICNNCLQKEGRGNAHSCNVQEASENSIILLETLPEKQQEKFITHSLKKKMNSTKTAVDNISSIHKHKIELSTLGSKIKVCINPEVNKKTIFSLDSLRNFQLYTGVSSNHIEKIANYLRSNAGRNCIPPNSNQHMTKHQKY